MRPSSSTTDNRCVERILVTALAAGLLAAVLAATTVLAVGSTQDAQPAAGALAVAQGNATPDERADRDGLGPPPWANAGGGPDARRGKAAQSWKDDWRALTPAQKTQKMTALARAHEEGMRTWNRCVRAAGNDTAERRDCQKPLPPGLAKKQP